MWNGRKWKYNGAIINIWHFLRLVIVWIRSGHEVDVSISCITILPFLCDALYLVSMGN